MSLDMWFRDDVVRILAALSSAGEDRPPAYQEALRDVGLAFGLQPRISWIPPEAQALAEGRRNND